MTRIVIVLIGLGLLASGCGQAAPGRPSSLQQLDEMQGKLTGVEVLARQVSVQVGQLDALMQADRSSEAGSAARRLGRSAGALATRAWGAAFRIHRLSAQTSTGKARPYFRLLETVLNHEALEGRDLQRVSALVQTDPLVVSPQHVRSLATLMRAARTEAASAVAASRQAGAWRKRWKALLTYTPVP